MIDKNDLRQFKASELQIGGIFYRKDDDGFHTCRITEEDVKKFRESLRKQTAEYSKAGRLYVRISKPWKVSHERDCKF